MNNILVSGTSSGLGAGLRGFFNAAALDRQNLDAYKKDQIEFDLLIHCAFERFHQSKDGNEYVRRSLDLSREVSKISAKRLIFISSIECNDPKKNGPYVLAKRKIEEIVSDKINFLNIRVPSLYGEGMVENQIYKLATQERPTLSLSGQSTFSLVSYSDIAHFIQNYNETGTISLFSDIVSLKSIAEIFNSSPKWGDYTYKSYIGDGERRIINENKSLEMYKNYIMKSIRVEHAFRG